MQKIAELIKKEAESLLKENKVTAVWAWQPGEFYYDNSPVCFTAPEQLDKLVYNEFCPSNLGKYLMAGSKKNETMAVFAKPCDTYGINQLIKDHRVKRELITVIGIPCSGMIDIKKIKSQGAKGIISVSVNGDDVIVTTAYGDKNFKKSEVLLAKCMSCKGSDYMIADKELGEKMEVKCQKLDPQEGVKKLEAMTSQERFAFWQQELSKCIRCNACRDICPACSCEQCIFDNQEAAVAGKASANTAEEQMFHIIRAYHVAGRCVGCGECARVCPQGIQLGLLNTKFTKDINEFYGKYQPGADDDSKAPLVDYKFDDVEPTISAKGVR